MQTRAASDRATCHFSYNMVLSFSDKHNTRCAADRQTAHGVCLLQMAIRWFRDLDVAQVEGLAGLDGELLADLGLGFAAEV